jgi:hypothetical protein
METVEVGMPGAAQSGAYYNSTLALVMINLYENTKGSYVGKQITIGLKPSCGEALKR